MTGKICLVTGATAGIGLVTARVLAERGATVLVVGRNPEKTAAVVSRIKAETGNPAIESFLADLSSQQEIRRLAQQVKERHPRLDVLVNNAGALFLRRQLSVDGIEMTFALNHLGYFLLTNLLLDRLGAAASPRIVNVASGAHWRAVLNFNDLQGQQRYGGWRAYCQSKLANLLFTYELARRLEGARITVNALHPGVVATDFGSNSGWWWRWLVRPVLRRFSISSEQGAQTMIYLATAPEVEGISDQYFVERKPVPSSPASYDPVAAARLWQISAELTSLPTTEQPLLRTSS